MNDDAVGRELRPMLKLYNTLGASEHHFVPADGETVRIYSCGPTVYSSPHIGNMRMYLFADLLRRTLTFAGYELKSAMNITDVGHLTSDADAGDDKMARAAALEHVTAWQVAEKYTAMFFNYADQLNILPMTYVLRATDHIKEQIALIQTLEEKGVVYRTSDGMYFDTSMVPDYGKLTPNDDRENLVAQERVAFVDKRRPTDFALWKFSPPDGPRRDMEWDSPWGVGFPGWHIECSAMAMAYLGETLDIHVGGIDHIAIHHTNEIAQSETATGKPFSRWWMHGAFLIPEGEKRMGKSEGNHITLANLVEQGYHPLEFRYLVLLSHYRSPLTFSAGALDAAATAYRRLQILIAGLQEEAAGREPDSAWQDSPYLHQFVAALAEDINIPRAVATVWSMVRGTDTDAATKLTLLGLFDQVLGLDLGTAPVAAEVPASIRELAQRRWDLRAERKFAEADLVRDEVLALGYSIRDGRTDFEVVRVKD
jgi:cysteinyl-tRNA synthetase